MMQFLTNFLTEHLENSVRFKILAKYRCLLKHARLCARAKEQHSYLLYGVVLDGISKTQKEFYLLKMPFMVMNY